MLPNDEDQPHEGDAPSPVEEAFKTSVLDRIARIEEKIDQLLRDQQR